MATTTNEVERDKALAWIARQLHWERVLEDLRTGEPASDREQKAA